MPVELAADTVHTIVVLDDPSALKIDALMDAAGSQIMPKGGTSTGLGGMASSPAADPAPWLLTMAAGALLAAAGFAGLRRSRHAAAAAINCEAGDSHAAAKQGDCARVISQHRRGGQRR